jgi:DNA-binding NtrC family response regulator
MSHPNLEVRESFVPGRVSELRNVVERFLILCAAENLLGVRELAAPAAGDGGSRSFNRPAAVQTSKARDRAAILQAPAWSQGTILVSIAGARRSAWRAVI